MTEKLPKLATVELDGDMCIEVQAQHIHAAGVFVSKVVSKYYSRSVLTAVCVRREGIAVKVQATDSFRLISIESEAEEDGPDETILIPYKEVKAALPKKGLVVLCLNHETGMLSITSAGSSTTVNAVEGRYPDVEQLFKLPGKGTIDGTAQFGINAKLVADAGKACALALGSKGQDLRFTCTGELKPILFTNLQADDTARVRGLIMPVPIQERGRPRDVNSIGCLSD